MKIHRRFTRADRGVYEQVRWGRRSSRIVNPDGSVVFEMNDVEVPAEWSQLATDIMVSKYFRKAGVPLTCEEGKPLRDEQGKPITGPEKSARQVIHRLAGCWRDWGERHGYFDTSEDAQAFYDELAYMMLRQVAAPNSPQWFNTGLNWAYGINGPAQGHYYTDPSTGETKLSEDAYSRGQPHACFIQSVDDDLVNSGGIMDLWVREARLFKYGSGTGTNFSRLRAEDERLSGGGRSSGLMSFLKIGDRAAGAIKSGGTTRRAAKMVCLDLDHPDIEQFVNWKVREELKVAAMVEGLKRLPPEQRETAERLGLKLDYDFNGESYHTVSGQNSNNSVRVPNRFFHVLDEGGDWELTRRTDGKLHKRVPAKELWDQVGFAAWRCADPGVQFDTTVNEWHTCPASGRINASNPCCFTGDTLVETLEGPVRIDELKRMADRREQLPNAASFDFASGKPVLRKIKHAWKAGEAYTLARVRTEKGLSLTCTPEHRWYTHDGRAVAAAELTPGTRLRQVVQAGAAVLCGDGDAAAPFQLDSPSNREADRVKSVELIELDRPVAVYDIEVEGTHNFSVWDGEAAAGVHGVIVSNSEYMFLDNTACNLASINLLRLYDSKTRTFDIAGYEHAVELWTVVLEISVLMAQYPSKEIARLSHEYRTLGLGYANLGAMLMQAGVPYDSDLGRAIGGTLAAVLTGRSYAASAAMAAELGPFPGYFKNREHMLRVVRNHRRAAYGVPRDRDEAARHELGGYEGLETAPVPIDAAVMEGDTRPFGGPQGRLGGIVNGADLLVAARRAWDDALREGERHGYRNAQTTVIAPTGTIGLLMDCDTTGVEPDFALVKFKKLAGGGYFKIANQSLRPALEALGYGESQVRDIMTYVMGHATLSVPMPGANGELVGDAVTFGDFLRHHGLDDAALKKAGEALCGAMDLSFVFNAWTLGEAAIKSLGAEGRPDVLRALGLTRKQVETLNELVCGTGTVEGAPHLRAEHYAVFDCANKCGKTGERFIQPTGHIHMMAAVQPFISGAISKTINLPNNATVEDIKAAYRLSWELGLKANALYRDGCKLSQPLNSVPDADEAEDEEAIEAGKEEVSAAAISVANRAASAETDPGPFAPSAAGFAGAGQRQPVEKIVERIVERPMRRRLPNTRKSITHKFNVAGHEGYLTVGLYDDGAPGELFITMAKEGSTIGGIMDSLGTAISVALQYGVPIESLVNKFSHQRFEPAGMTDNREIPFAKSLVDYIFRWMGMEFIAGYRAANAPKRGADAPGSAAPPKAVPERDAPVPVPAVRLAEASDRITHGNGNGNGNGRGNGNGGQPVSIDDPHLLDAAIEKNNPLAKLSTRSSDVLAVAEREQTSGGLLVQNPLNEANGNMMGDAPACDVCGSITIRNGTCYKCVNCGNSMGCS